MYCIIDHNYVCSIILQRDILSCAEHLDQLEEDLGTRMASLKEIVQSKTAVPTSQVYVSVCRVCVWGGGGGGWGNLSKAFFYYTLSDVDSHTPLLENLTLTPTRTGG